MECTFCKLKDDNSKIIAEDKLCYAVFDKYPIERGHMLVISKEHYQDLLSTPNEVISGMSLMAVKLGRMLRDRLGADGVQISTNVGDTAGQLIMHVHIHVIPRYAGKPNNFSKRGMLSQTEQETLKKLLAN
ncbi:HIT family protein [Candidatus Marsarchaeota archaeon]|nr:HIT family protein [Candidatus Marsarchaeota archaeon]MCL5100018.1 HIT family protein [Candidatus Marsarchaeota archaeon]